MAYDDVLTRNEDSELAVRVVETTGDNPASSYDDVYTRDNNGKLAVRVVGGGGGGDVDTTKVVNKAAVLPTAGSSNVGKVYMYSGETDANYTHGYIYECQATTVYEDTTTFQPATLSGTVVNATSGAVADLCAEYITGDITEIVSGTMTYDNASDLWVFVGKDSEDNTVGTFQIYQMDYEDAGFTFTGTPEDGDVVSFVTEITASSTYSWVRIDVQPAGGSDEHNLGWFADLTALQTAHPTGVDGDFAILGSTDTVWVWDSGTSAWKDTDQKGQVTSVNGQTGAVTVQETLVSGTNIKTVDGNSLLGSGNLELSTYLTYPAGWTTNSTTKAFCDSIAADSSAVKGKAYLGEVTCSDLPESMLNAEVVVEIMDGTTAQDKVIVLSLKSGNVAPYAWQYVYWDNGTNVSGWKTWQETLVSGTNIKTINNNSILGSGNLDVDGLPSQAGHLGEFLTTDGYVADWSPLAMVATTGSYNNLEDTPDIPTEATQVGAVPEWGSMRTADAEYENVIVQYSGATTSTYTNGYFYRCDSTLVSAASATISQTVGSSLSDLAVVAADFESSYPDSGTYDFVFDGSDWYYDEEVVDLASLGITFSGTPDADDTIEVVFTATEYSYAWNRVDVQPGSSLPSQTGNSGKFLTTDGTDASWATINALQNTATGSLSLTVGGTAATSTNSVNVGVGSQVAGVGYTGPIAIGSYSSAGGNRAIAIGQQASSSGTGSIAIGRCTISSNNTIGLNATEGAGLSALNDANSMYVAIKNGVWTKLLSSDETVPADRLVNAINKYSTMPTASADNLGWIVQFTGTTDSTYTHGHLYECVSDGQDPATYSWTEVQLGGGGSSYTAGTGIDITNGTISVTSPTLVNQTNESGNLLVSETPTVGSNNYRNVLIASGNTTLSNWTSDLIAVVSGNFVSNNKDNSVYIGSQMQTTRSIQRGVAIGAGSGAGGTGGYLTGSICIGYGAKCSATKAIQISCDGVAQYTNADTNTFKIGNENGNFEMMSADGTIPAARHASLPASDGTYVLKLVISGGVPTLSWVAE